MGKTLTYAVAGLLLTANGVHSASNTSTNAPENTLVKGNATYCCSTLQSRMTERVSFQGHAAYESEQSGASGGYWSMQEAELRPACRVTPMTAAEVASAVVILAEANCSFAVRGGGHTSWGGAANIGGHGITIDLSGFGNITVSDDRKTASVGAGNRWGDVYGYLEPMGLQVSGGRVASVGVGGLTLGGGKTFFASLYGFACDNVVNFELVTGQGQILQVNEASHADLFKALKGGSNNFGIVTRFDLATFNQGVFWGGQVIYPASTALQQDQALYKLAATPRASTTNATGDSQNILAYVTTSAGKFFANYYTHTDPTAWPAPLAAFETIQPQLSSTLRISNLSDFSTELGVGTPNGQRYIFGALTFVNDQTFFAELRNISDAAFAPFWTERPVPGLVLSVVLQPLAAAMLEPGCNKNSLGLCPSDGNLMILDLTVSWTLGANNTAMNRAAHTLINNVAAAAKKKGLLHDYIYLNYALKNQKPIASYGEASVANLNAMSKKFDPDQVFQRLVPGGFKL